MPRRTPGRPTDVSDAAAAVFRAERARRGWSLATMADAINDLGYTNLQITPQTVYKIEKRQREINDIAGFAEAFGMPLVRMWDEIETERARRAEVNLRDMAESGGAR